jgi:hypothetical protein
MVGKRLLAALAAFVLLGGFVAACGDDDDDVAADDTEVSSDDEAVDGGEPITDFCADFNRVDDDDETPVEDVQTSLDTALAAQDAVDDEEFADAVGVLAGVLQTLIDEDDDGVVTTDEAATAFAETKGAEQAAGIVAAGCDPGSRRYLGGAAS